MLSLRAGNISSWSWLEGFVCGLDALLGLLMRIRIPSSEKRIRSWKDLTAS